jgi:hypothetical protein
MKENLRKVYIDDNTHYGGKQNYGYKYTMCGLIYFLGGIQITRTVYNFKPIF